MTSCIFKHYALNFLVLVSQSYLTTVVLFLSSPDIHQLQTDHKSFAQKFSGYHQQGDFLTLRHEHWSVSVLLRSAPILQAAASDFLSYCHDYSQSPMPVSRSDVWPGFSQFLTIGNLVRYSSHVKSNVLSDYLASVKCMANLTDSYPGIDVDERQTEWHLVQSGSNHQYHF